MTALPAAIESFLAHLALRGRQLTANTTRQALEQLVAWAGQQSPPLEVLIASAADLQAFQAWLVTGYRSPSGRPLARSTCATRVLQVQSFYRWCAARGLIAIDPSRDLGVHAPRSRVVVRDRLSFQAATALVQSCAGIVATAPVGTHTHAEALRNLAAICLALTTGRRIGGMTTLRVADLDVALCELRVEREKGATGRVLPVAGWAVAVLAQYLRDARPLLARGHDAPWLFLNQPGDGPITRIALRWVLARLIDRTKEENPDLTELATSRITWHSLRVTFAATLLFANGCDIRSVNELMLHRRLSTTARYTPVPIEELRQVFRRTHPRP